MQIYNKENECYGCGACISVCKKNAISMQPDKYGFIYPHINNNLCVLCGRCNEVCPIKDGKQIQSLKKCYIAASKKTSQLLNSSSGGIFPLIGEKIIELGGGVFGAVYDRDSTGKIIVHHQIAENKEELIPLQNSKYVQSNAYVVYNLVKQKLDSGKLVLFTGTPCQIAALYNILNKKYDNLYTIENICHGVPSTLLFQSYLEFWENKNNAKIVSIRFRDKTLGWGKTPKIIYIDKNGKKKEKVFQYYKSSYFMMFLKGDILRESCYNCKFASEYRVADMTLGDYWGVEWEHPELLSKNGGHIVNKHGVSCVICNTNKADYLLDLIKANIYIADSKYEKISPHNLQLLYPFPRSKNRQIILQTYLNEGYKAIDRMSHKFYSIKTWKGLMRVKITTFFKETRGFKVIYGILKNIKIVRETNANI